MHDRRRVRLERDPRMTASLPQTGKVNSMASAESVETPKPRMTIIGYRSPRYRGESLSRRLIVRYDGPTFRELAKAREQ